MFIRAFDSYKKKEWMAYQLFHKVKKKYLVYIISQTTYVKGLEWDTNYIQFELAGDTRNTNQKFNYAWNISESGRKITLVSAPN